MSIHEVRRADWLTNRTRVSVAKPSDAESDTRGVPLRNATPWPHGLPRPLGLGMVPH